MHDHFESIQATLKAPVTIRYFEDNKSTFYFYKEFKEHEQTERYLMVAVRYLNGEGFVITSFFTDRIEGILWKTK